MKKILLIISATLFTINSVFAQCGLKARTAQQTTISSSVVIPEGTKEKAYKKLAKISKKEARKIATTNYEGKVKKAHLINKENTLVWLLEVKGDEGIKELFVDPESGAFLGFGLTK